MTIDNPILSKSIPELDVEDDAEVSELLHDLPSITLKITPDFCGVRLDKVLSQLVSEYSRGRIQQWIDTGHVTVDGQGARSKSIVLGGETVVIKPQTVPEENAFHPEPIALTIIHEDDALMVVNKPAGLVVHPAAGNWSGTLLNGLLHYCPMLAGVPRAGIVHRLDKDTSGLMVVAKTLQTQTDLVRQLQFRSVKREYLALVWGAPYVNGTVDAAIGRHLRDRIKMAVSTSASAKPAITHYQRLATGTLHGHAVSLLRCVLETGRTHQIRVHMQSIGFPLVGDPLYGKTHLASVFPRQALHATRLGLVHPVTGDSCDWSISLPDDFSHLLRSAGMNAAVEE